MSSSTALPVRFALALLAAAIAAALLVPSAPAAWPGRAGPIVYEGLESGPKGGGSHRAPLRNCTLRPHSGPEDLTPYATDSDPQVSPDAKRIVYAGSEHRAAGRVAHDVIYIAPFRSLLNATAFPVRILTDSLRGFRQSEPTFDRSGRRVLFVSGHGRGDIYSVGLGGGGLRQVTSGPATDSAPAFSPRGNQVVFVRSGYPLRGGGSASAAHLFSIRPDGSHLRDLTPWLTGDSASDPDFSPSGGAIAFAIGSGAGADIYSVRPDGSQFRRLTGSRHLSVLPGYGFTEPAFSPAGGDIIAVAVNAYHVELVHIRPSVPAVTRPLFRSSEGQAPVWAPAAPAFRRRK